MPRITEDPPVALSGCRHLAQDTDFTKVVDYPRLAVSGTEHG
jgi:hypothetical protein